jgi:hypothetical protein
LKVTHTERRAPADFLSTVILPDDSRLPAIHTPAMPPALQDRVDTLAQVRERRPALRDAKPLGITTLPSEPLYYPGEFNDWLIRTLPAGETIEDVPEKVFRQINERLDALESGGIVFDDYIIAEELPRPESMRPMWTPLTKERVRQAGELAVAVAAGAAAVAGGAAAVLAALFASTDPILFGVLKDSELPDDVGFVVEIARWAH